MTLVEESVQVAGAPTDLAVERRTERDEDTSHDFDTERSNAAALNDRDRRLMTCRPACKLGLRPRPAAAKRATDPSDPGVIQGSRMVWPRHLPRVIARVSGRSSDGGVRGRPKWRAP